MAAPTPDQAVVDTIDTALGTLTKGTDLFHGPVRAENDSIPVKCVFVISSGGPTPINYADGSRTPQTFFPNVEIFVRSDSQDYAGGLTLARSVRDAIHDNIPTGYVSARVVESEPLYLGETDRGSHEWSINVELIFDGAGGLT